VQIAFEPVGLVCYCYHKLFRIALIQLHLNNINTHLIKISKMIENYAITLFWTYGLLLQKVAFLENGQFCKIFEFFANF